MIQHNEYHPDTINAYGELLPVAYQHDIHLEFNDGTTLTLINYRGSYWPTSRPICSHDISLV
jgi:hypothetical protein